MYQTAELTNNTNTSHCHQCGTNPQIPSQNRQHKRLHWRVEEGVNKHSYRHEAKAGHKHTPACYRYHQQTRTVSPEPKYSSVYATECVQNRELCCEVSGKNRHTSSSKHKVQAQPQSYNKSYKTFSRKRFNKELTEHLERTFGKSYHSSTSYPRSFPGSAKKLHKPQADLDCSSDSSLDLSDESVFGSSDTASEMSSFESGACNSVKQLNNTGPGDILKVHKEKVLKPQVKDTSSKERRYKHIGKHLPEKRATLTVEHRNVTKNLCTCEDNTCSSSDLSVLRHSGISADVSDWNSSSSGSECDTCKLEGYDGDISAAFDADMSVACSCLEQNLAKTSPMRDLLGKVTIIQHNLLAGSQQAAVDHQVTSSL